VAGASLARLTAAAGRANRSAELGGDRQPVLEVRRRLYSHPCTLEAREVLGDDIVAGGVINELEKAGCIALVLVAWPTLVLRAHTHGIPALEENGADGVDERFQLRAVRGEGLRTADWE
jgi:hypothetical protein